MKGWRTVLINLGIAVFGVLEAVDWTGMLGGEAGWVIAVVAFANMALRAVTSTPVGQSV